MEEKKYNIQYLENLIKNQTGESFELEFKAAAALGKSDNKKKK